MVKPSCKVIRFTDAVGRQRTVAVQVRRAGEPGGELAEIPDRVAAPEVAHAIQVLARSTPAHSGGNRPRS